ncbi:squalene monooxygenase SE1-like [Rutidosis leptorrhynchoides]|uniref:squalene monooxygenase SE1-like n=1 Tax=Rutidosis leptorrhynchoides TaxID=125765 RepID=UPI003A99C4F7
MLKTCRKLKDTWRKCVNDFNHDAVVVDTDVIIVGAGVVAAALAYTLAKDGRHVHLIERDLTEQDRLVDEVLHPGGYLKLLELDLADCVEEIEAQRVSGYAIYLNDKNIRLDYPLENFPFRVCGKSFHNGRFVQRMRNKASSLSNVKIEQGTVTSLLKKQGTVQGVHYKTKNGHERSANAPLTVVCDGCVSNLRRDLCNSKIEVPSCFVALVLENTRLAYPNHAHVVLADPSIVLLYSISNTEIRCIVDIPSEKVPSISNGEMAKYLKNVVAPKIPHELSNAFIAAIDRGNIRTMPNRTMSADAKITAGAILLGDAFNMRHPLTGGGMTAALSDIVLLRDILRPLNDLNDTYKDLQRFYILRKPMSFTLNMFASVVYNVFRESQDPARRELRSACFDYLSLGCLFADGPMSIFSALDQRPLALLCPCIAFGVYSVGRLLTPFPSPRRSWLAIRLITVGLEIIHSVFRSEGVMQLVLFPSLIPA